jgi:hypothetical protein
VIARHPPPDPRVPNHIRHANAVLFSTNRSALAPGCPSLGEGAGLRRLTALRSAVRPASIDSPKRHLRPLFHESPVSDISPLPDRLHPGHRHLPPKTAITGKDRPHNNQHPVMHVCPHTLRPFDPGPPSRIPRMVRPIFRIAPSILTREPARFTTERKDSCSLSHCFF